MDFTNPDNQLKVFLTFASGVILLFIVSIWTGEGRLAWTAAVLLIPTVALGVWTGISYDDESPDEARERKEAKKKVRSRA